MADFPPPPPHRTMCSIVYHNLATTRHVACMNYNKHIVHRALWLIYERFVSDLLAVPRICLCIFCDSVAEGCTQSA